MAQSDGARSGDTDVNEMAGKPLADPSLMSADEHELHMEPGKTGLDEREIGKLVAECIRDIRQQAGIKDTIPLRDTLVQRHR